MKIITLGKYELIMKDDENIFAYKRLYKDEEMIVYCNFSNQEVGYDTSILNDEKILIKNYEKHQRELLNLMKVLFSIKKQSLGSAFTLNMIFHRISEII